MPYTSGQYKWMLYQRLRQAFSMKTAADRAYTQTFFLRLFDDSVTVTEVAYNNFVALMDQELDHMAELGVYACEDIPSAEIESGSLLLINAFAQIGVTLTIAEPTEQGGPYTATFVKPDGETLVYPLDLLSLRNYFYINARAGTEYRYANLSAPAYDVTRDVEDADTMDPKVAGPGTWWSYAAADGGTMTISGSGAYAGATTDTQLGGGAFTTLIVGAEVSRLLECCMMSSETALVLLTPADGQITLDPKFNAKYGSCNDTVVPLDVYTDCAAARTILSGAEFAETITLHPLSDWEG